VCGCVFAYAGKNIKLKIMWEYLEINKKKLNVTSEIEAFLNEKGKERWECFQIDKIDTNDDYMEFTFYFKRLYLNDKLNKFL